MLRILTQNIIVPTFNTKVTEYLCSGGFVLQTNFDLYLAIFDGFFLKISFKRCCCPELKFEKIFHL